MPWATTDPVKERLRFIGLVESGLFNMSELCERFGISRPTGYTLLHRYQQEGLSGLQDRSRAPRHSPQSISGEMQELLLKLRCSHPDWGATSIRPYLQRTQPDLVVPAASTIGDLFKRKGLIEGRRRKRKQHHPGRAPLVAEAPNQVWTTDFKGQFRTRDRNLCYPLTIADAHTRFLLACDGLGSTAHNGAHAVFEHAFRTYGLPEVVRSDNGGPFATKALAGLSRLSVWWTKLGIRHDRIEPGKPQQNGSHERMHRKLKRATLRPAAADAAEQQRRFDDFRHELNWVKPHHALATQTPGSLYVSSPRAMPERLPPPHYDGHMLVRRVRRNGIVYFRDRQFFLSELLVGEPVGLEEIDDGVWSIYFYDLLLARLDERTWSISG